MQDNPFHMREPETLAEEDMHNAEVLLYQAVNNLASFVTALQQCSVDALSDCLRTQLAATDSDAQDRLGLIQLALQNLVCPALPGMPTTVTATELHHPATA